MELQEEMLKVESVHGTEDIFNYVTYSFPLTKTLFSLFFFFLCPHLHLLSLCAFPSPCLIWLKELKGNSSSRIAEHTPLEFPGPPSIAVIVSGHGQLLIENSRGEGLRAQTLETDSLLPYLHTGHVTLSKT